MWVLEDDLDCLYVYHSILDIKFTTTYFSELSQLLAQLESSETVPDIMLADLYLPDGNFLDFIGKTI